MRLCDLQAIPVVVARRGDPDAGAVYVNVHRRGEGCRVYAPARAADGRRAWVCGTGDTPVDEREANAYLARQADVDPDIWVIEVDDADGRYALDGEVL